MIWNWTVLIVFLLIMGGLFYSLFKGVWKDKSIYIRSYKSLESFKKVSLQIGIAYYLAIPLLKSHPSKDTYLSQVSIDILSALANVLFILGALSFLEKCHEIYKENNES